VTIGIFSDTHDNLPQTEKAISLFNNKKVKFVLHAGDFVAPFTVARLKALSCDWAGVFGNNDGERKGLWAISEGKIKEDPLRINLDNKKITLVHDINNIDLKTEQSQVVIFGHTHKSEIRIEFDKFLINPGECGGWLTGASTVAILDLDSLSSEIFNL
jgi:putative phosphoesterase